MRCNKDLARINFDYSPDLKGQLVFPALRAYLGIVRRSTGRL
jgi:hypothetical protein